MDDLQTYIKVGSRAFCSRCNIEFHVPLQSLEEFDKTSNDISLRFTRLRQGIEDFRISLRSNVESKQDSVRKEIEEIDKKIQGLEEKLEELVPFGSLTFSWLMPFFHRLVSRVCSSRQREYLWM